MKDLRLAYFCPANRGRISFWIRQEYSKAKWSCIECQKTDGEFHDH